MLSKFQEIQKEHEALKVRNFQLKSDNTRMTKELESLNSLIE